MAGNQIRNLPDGFVELLEAAAGGPVPHVLDALNGAPVTAIRFNPLKVKSQAAATDILASLINNSDDFSGNSDALSNNSERLTRNSSSSVGYKKVPWCSDGYIIDERPIFTLDPAFHSGAYYVQEPSSMVLEILRPLINNLQKNKSLPLSFLDIAASPGGKTTHLISMKPPGSLMISNEVIRSRVGPLIENVIKWGDHDVLVTNNDPSDFAGLTSFFDFILADVPCSGEGMFRKYSTSDRRESKTTSIAIAEWSLQNVAICQSRQRRIIADIWPALAPGGILVYSTCTFNNRENDDNILWIRENLGADIVNFGEFTDTDILKNAGVRFSWAGGLQFFPGEVVGEGLYMAVLRKPFSSDIVNSLHNRQLEKYIHRLKRSFPILKKSSQQYEQFAPLHEIALSAKYSNEYLSIELTRDCALLYLSKGNFTPQCLQSATRSSLTQSAEFSAKIREVPDKVFPGVSDELPKGYYRVTYKGMGLGFVKHLGNRVNNLFPVERRILMKIS